MSWIAVMSIDCSSCASPQTLARRNFAVCTVEYWPGANFGHPCSPLKRFTSAGCVGESYQRAMPTVVPAPSRPVVLAPYAALSCCGRYPQLPHGRVRPWKGGIAEPSRAVVACSWLYHCEHGVGRSTASGG